MYHFFQRSSSPQAAPQQKGPVMEEAAMALLLLDGSAAPQVSSCCLSAIEITVPSTGTALVIGMTGNVAGQHGFAAQSRRRGMPWFLLLHSSQGAEAARVRGQRTRGVHAADARFNEDEHTLLPHAAKLPRFAPL